MSVVQGAGRMRGGRNANERRATAAAIAAPSRRARIRLQPLKTRVPAQGPAAVQRGGVTDGPGSGKGLPAAS